MKQHVVPAQEYIQSYNNAIRRVSLALYNHYSVIKIIIMHKLNV